MNLVGFYPFLVTVWNLFEPEHQSKDRRNGIKLSVQHFYHPSYFQSSTSDWEKGFKIEHGMTSKSSIIDPGSSLSFPMFYGDEYLILSLHIGDHSRVPTSPYQLNAGGTAECCSLKKLGDPIRLPNRVSLPKHEGDYWQGGTWVIEPGTSWTMKIRKIIPDPQSDDVTVGPGTPG